MVAFFRRLTEHRTLVIPPLGGSVVEELAVRKHTLMWELVWRSLMKIGAMVLGLVLATGATGAAWGAGAAAGADGRFNVRDFGAMGDGKTLDTAAINAAIEAAASAGGGTVYFLAGTYASYAVHLKSNLALYLEHGAVLRAAGEISGVRQAQGGSSREEPKRDEGPAGNQMAPTSGPAVALVDVNGADFQHLNIQRFEDVPCFALNGARDFSTLFVQSLADMKRDRVENELISK